MKQKAFKIEEKHKRDTFEDKIIIRRTLRDRLLELEEKKGTDWMESFLENLVVRVHKRGVKHQKENGDGYAGSIKLRQPLGHRRLIKMWGKAKKDLRPLGRFEQTNKVVEELLREEKLMDEKT
ncbi:MAG: hypothetical protein JSW41_00425 [Candidatus Aenigmatarchaeota archaeon]|nr:MAG: hypothetical protein JSW41_00425 [Candidatus Aenigmarchaeota archaeon]